MNSVALGNSLEAMMHYTKHTYELMETILLHTQSYFGYHNDCGVHVVVKEASRSSKAQDDYL